MVGRAAGFAILVLLAGPAVPASAKVPPPPVRSEADCLANDPAPPTPISLTECMYAAAEADAALRQRVERLLGNLSALDAERLRGSQAAWTVYRDAECRIGLGELENTAFATMLIACQADMNRSRLAALEDLAIRLSQ